MRKKPLLTALSAAAIGIAAALSVPVASTVAAPRNAVSANVPASKLYIVRLAEAPAVAYDGSIKGYAATAPRKGQKIDPTSPQVINYRAYLASRADALLASVGGARKAYDYGYVFPGFAAELSDEQATKLRATPGVLAVSKDLLRNADTSSTPTFLGLNATGGLWDQLGGVGAAGDGVIIGIIDTGIWPENPSFSDRTGLNGNGTQDGKLAYQQIPGWHGKCTPGETFPASKCNQKLIGAQWFNAAFGGDAGAKAAMPWEFMSARDYGGHGSHTSSTAGGNNGVQVTGPAAAYGTISGIAPHARIATYKALWEVSPGQGSGYNSDLVAAIDQAVADGVDVINYSISGTQTNFRDPVEISFMFAANAGVFVAASAGNSGPTTATVAHPSPWITTVAAGTHNRTAKDTVRLGNGTTYSGVGLVTSPVTAPLINSTDAAAAGASASAVSLCFSTSWNGGTPALDPAKVAGKIVVCDRGTNDRVNKSLAVQEAGGVGMILVNTSNNTLNADFHSVPTVHLQYTDNVAVHAYAATQGATATINASTMDYSAAAPFTASFSSRGPLKASGDLLKPDLIAPGQDILAAVAPPGNSGRNFDLYSGTSMSSPHVAGLAALFKQLHPDWSPMAIKSALMTTGYNVLDTGISEATRIFRQGAGHVRPNDAVNPGLVFDSSMVDWLGFLCGTQLGASYCESRGIPLIAPSNFNVPSIAISALAGSRTVTRTVTNVGAKGTYGVTVNGLAGFNVTVAPATFTLNPGQKQTLQITITRTSATLNAYTGGYLTWSDGAHSVRIPVAVAPVPLAAPTQVNATAGGSSYGVAFGYTGTFTAAPRGLVPATTGAGSVSTGGHVDFPVTIPANTTYARISLFDANVSHPSDLDLEVYLGSTLVGSSGSGTSAEEVNFVNPTSGSPITLTVRVVGFDTQGSPTNFTLFNWSLGTASAGNMNVSAPAAAVLGGTGTINLSFSGLTSGVKYLGSVAYGGASGMPNPTIVRVDP